MVRRKNAKNNSHVFSLLSIQQRNTVLHTKPLHTNSPTAVFRIDPIGQKRELQGRSINKYLFDNVALCESTSSYYTDNVETRRKKVVIIGAGWGGLSTAHALFRSSNNKNLDITVIDASSRIGGLVRDGFTTLTGTRPAEAGQHGFWNSYHNIFHLLQNDLRLDMDSILTEYAPQGQYSPRGLEAIWPVYRDQTPALPTGLAQALYTKFQRLSLLDRMTAIPLLLLIFSEFDNSEFAWAKYDSHSFLELCKRLRVSKKCYDEVFEPMILTGLFAPGAECSAAAALSMAYFFVLQSQNSFDVRWCRGNVGDTIFDPWVEILTQQRQSGKNGVNFMTSTRVVGFESIYDDTGRNFPRTKSDKLTHVLCKNEKNREVMRLDADTVVFAVGAAALNGMFRNSPVLARHEEFGRFANLRGTSVLATRIFLDRAVPTPYSANACWGFDKGVGMTMFDISKLHGTSAQRGSRGGGTSDTTYNAPGCVLEVDYYHCNSLLVMDDEEILVKVKKDLDIILGLACQKAKIVDAAIVRLPQAVNWYYPGSYADLPDLRSSAIENVYFVGDLVRSRHGSWSQEKAFVTGIEAANAILGKPPNTGIIPLSHDEAHVAVGRRAVAWMQTLLGGGNRSRGPFLVDFLL